MMSMQFAFPSIFNFLDLHHLLIYETPHTNKTNDIDNITFITKRHD